jgi:hypothetical protein
MAASGPAPSGFFNGVCHGALMLVDGIRIAAGAPIALYDVVNTGWGYDAGFLLGSMLFGSVFLTVLRAGLSWLLAASMGDEIVKSVVGNVISALFIGVAFLLADWSHLVPRVVGDLGQAAACGVGLGAWHRVTALFALVGQLVFDDLAIYQVGCSAGYSIGYVLPQAIFGVLAMVVFLAGWKTSRR